KFGTDDSYLYLRTCAGEFSLCNRSRRQNGPDVKRLSSGLACRRIQMGEGYRYEFSVYRHRVRQQRSRTFHQCADKESSAFIRYAENELPDSERKLHWSFGYRANEETGSECPLSMENISRSWFWSLV